MPKLRRNLGRGYASWKMSGKAFPLIFFFLIPDYSWRIEDGRDPPFGMFDNLRDLHLFTHASAHCSGLIAEESASM